jgi:hypothetical protein
VYQLLSKLDTALLLLQFSTAGGANARICGFFAVLLDDVPACSVALSSA